MKENLLALIRERRNSRNLRRICFQFIHQFLNSPVQLLVNAGIFACRIIIHNNVGINAMTFNHKAIFIVESKFRLGECMRRQQKEAIRECPLLHPMCACQ